MKKYRIVFHGEKCVGCGACAVACADQNDIPVCSGADMLRRVTVSETETAAGTVFSWKSISCLHCDPAPCAEACARGCIRRDPATGFVVHDDTACIGCGLCGSVCPVGAPVYTPEGKMRKCDGCHIRVRAGLMPACVRVCPFDALTLETR